MVDMSSQESIDKAVKELMAEWEAAYPKWHDEVLERIIRREMYLEALRHLSDQAYKERCEAAVSAATKCFNLLM